MNLSGRKLSVNLIGDDVALLQREVQQLGFTIAPAELQRKFFGGTTLAAVNEFQTRNKLKPNGTVDEVTAALINRQVDAQGQPPTPSPQQPETPAPQPQPPAPTIPGPPSPSTGNPDDILTIHGYVRSESGDGVANVAVNAVRVMFRATRVVGAAQTASDGSYRIECRNSTPESPTRVDAIANNETISSSRLTCVRKGKVEIDFGIPDKKLPGPTEYKRLRAVLQPLIADANLALLKDDETEILSCATAVPVERLLTLRFATETCAAQPGLTEAVYGLVRMSGASDLRSLVHLSEKRLLAALRAAATKRIAEELTTDEIAALRALFGQAHFDAAFASTASDPLSALVADAAVRRKIFDEYVRFDGAPQEFWSKTLAGIPGFDSDAAREQLTLALALADVTQGNTQLVKALTTANATHGVSSLRDLTKLSIDNWKELISSNGVPVPDAIPGAGADKKARNYAAILTQTVSNMLPTAALTAQLDLSANTDLKSAGQLLDRFPTVDLTGRPVRTIPDLAAGSKAEVKSLTSVQRLFKIAPNPPMVTALYGANLRSAWSVANETPTTLAAMTGGSAAPEAIAGFHEAAVFRSKAALYLFAAYSGNLAGKENPATPPPADADPTPETVTLLKDIFGADTLCKCDENQALDGPYAYYATVLMFLPKLAREELKTRRPDLWDLRFTPQHAKTNERYLQIALGVLENIAIDRATNVAPGSAWPANQTTWSEDQLAAAAEFPRREAYTPLLQSRFPWTLPFDLDAAEARAFGGLLGVRRFELMEALQNRVGPLDPTAEAVAAEFLGLTQIAWNITTIPATAAELADIFPEIADRTQMTIAQLLNRAAIGPDELIELLDTRFVNASATPFDKRMGIESKDGSCDANSATLINPGDEALDRLHRLTRLWRALPWPVQELDSAIRALGAGTLNAASLEHITQLARLREQVKIPLEELLTWFADFDTSHLSMRPSLFAQLFLDNTILGASGGDAFVLNAPQTDEETDLKNPGGKLWESLPGIVAGMGTTAQDVKRLTTENDVLQLSTLSALFRQISLARAMGLDVPEYLAVRKLIDVDPFKSVAAARDFLDQHRRLKESDFSLDELRFLLLNEVPDTATSDLGLSDDAVTDIVRQLRASLVAVAADQSAASALPENSETFSKLAGSMLPSAKVDRLRSVVERRGTETVVQQQALLSEMAQQWPFLDVALQQSLLQDFAGTPTPEDYAARYRPLVRALVEFVGRQRRSSVVVQQLSDRFGLQANLMQQLLLSPFTTKFNTNPAAIPLDALADGLLDPTYWSDPLQPMARSELSELLRRIQKQALVLSRVKPRTEELSRLVRIAQASAGLWLDLNVIPVRGAAAATLRLAPIAQWLDYAGMRKRQPLDRPSLVEVIDTGPASFDESLDRLAASMAWDPSSLAILAKRMGLGKKEEFADQSVIRRIANAMRLLARSQLAAPTILSWISDPVSGEAASEIIAAARSFIGVAQWPKRAGAIRDGMLVQQRDALLAYLRGAGLPGEPAGKTTFPDEKAIFDRYHLDMKMGPGFLTTRLALATRSVQYFIERCLRGLEKVTLDAVKAEQYHSTVQSFRVWQAAITVILKPDALTDITMLTRRNERYLAFERTLAQKELTRENVFSAVRAYAGEVVDIAHLEVAGFHKNPVDGTLHVFARTGATPAIYYYARRELGEWSSFSRVNTEINAEGGVMLAVYHGLYAIWTVIAEKADESQSGSFSDPPPQPTKHLEIRIGWSVLQDGKWSAKRLSDPIEPKHWSGGAPAPKPGDRDRLVFKAVVADVSDGLETHQELRVICNLLGAPAQAVKGAVSTQLSPEFRFQSCTRAPVIVKAGGTGDVVSPPGTSPWRGTYFELPDPRTGGADIRGHEGHEDNLVLLSGNSPNVPPPSKGWPTVAPDHVPVLDQTPGQFQLVFPHQYAQPVSQSFFFTDDQWTFFVEYIGPSMELIPGSSLASVPVGALASNFVKGKVQIDSAELVAERASEHNRVLIDQQSGNVTPTWTRATRLPPRRPEAPVPLLYRFYTFNHPRACSMLQLLDDQGLEGLWRWNAANPVQAPTTVNQDFFVARYLPEKAIVDPRWPKPGVDFDETTSPFAEDNQNLFLYCPLRAAAAFTAAGKFDDAEWVLESIFRPMAGGTDQAPQRYWTYQPFIEGPKQSLAEFLALLNGSGEAAAKVSTAIADWQAHLFDPWRVARRQPLKLMKTVARMFMQNVLARANQNFATANDQEQLLRATTDYIWVLELAGELPRAVNPTKKQSRKPGDFRNFEEIEGALPEDSLIPETLENALPPLPPEANAGADRFPFAVAMQFAFCLPTDNVFDALRDEATVKLNFIRAGLDFNGQPRAFSVYGDRIDPMLLVRASAMGVDLSTALGAIEAPRPIYRFSVLLQKAKEFVAELRGLSGSLLSALTENDAESLSELRAEQERAVLQSMRNVKLQNLMESEQSLEGLSAYLEVVRKRNTYYKTRALMNPGEILGLELTGNATIIQAVAQGLGMLASAVKQIPNFTVGISGVGASPVSTVTEGGGNAGDAIGDTASALNMTASTLHAKAGIAGTVAGYQRRKEEWDMLADTTAVEIRQVTAQIAAQRARVEAAQADMDMLAVQQNNADAVKDFLASRFNNAQLRQFRIAQLSSVCHQAYFAAFGLAKSAERAYQLEMGFFSGTKTPQQSFIQFGYWQNNVNGVTAAEQLSVALQQLETSYLSSNVPEHVVTVRLSLGLIDPLALEALRRTGDSGPFEVLEEHITRFYPEAYFVRVQKLRVTAPCITGPYTPVPLKVSRNRHSIRLNDSLSGSNYASTSDADDRFLRSVGAVVSMFTSSGREDEDVRPGGDDGRYSWFDYGGLSGQYQISHPMQLGQFDASTLSDVILEFQLSFREGSSEFRDASIEHLKKNWLDRGYLLMRARSDFPDAWYRFLNPLAGTPQMLELPITRDRFPFAVQGNNLAFQDLSLLVEWEPLEAVPTPKNGLQVTVTNAAPLPATIAPVELNAAVGIQGLQVAYFAAPNIALDVAMPDPLKLQVVVVAAQIPDEYKVDVGSDSRINSKRIRDVLLLIHYKAG